MKNPEIINFQKVGKPTEGYLSIAEEQGFLPFNLKRSFWTYYTPENVSRGRHAHHKTEMVLVALKGNIRVITHTLADEKQEFILDDPNVGLYLSPLVWHEMYYSRDAIQLALCSHEYLKSDYIHSYEEFQNMIQEHKNSRAE